MKMLNKAEVETLFAANAVLFGFSDGLPISKAVELFGQEAIDFVKHMDVQHPGDMHNGYGIGGCTAFCITLRGAMIAATFNNVSAIQEAERRTASS